MALIDKRFGVGGCSVTLRGVCKLPPELVARVVGDTNLVGRVRFDPGLVIS